MELSYLINFTPKVQYLYVRTFRIIQRWSSRPRARACIERQVALIIRIQLSTVRFLTVIEWILLSKKWTLRTKGLMAIDSLYLEMTYEFVKVMQPPVVGEKIVRQRNDSLPASESLQHIRKTWKSLNVLKAAFLCLQKKPVCFCFKMCLMSFLSTFKHILRQKQTVIFHKFT